MNVPKKWLTLVVTALLGYSFGVSGVSAAGGDKKQDASPAPNPGGIEAILRLREKLPKSQPPTISELTLQGGEIVMTRQVIEYVTERMKKKEQVTDYVPEQYTVKVGDVLELRTRARPVVRWVERDVTVIRAVVRSVKEKVPANSIKAFTVTKDGKLESLATAKLRDLLVKPTPALIGDAEVDPRHLELIKSGTIYLAIPPGPVESLPKMPPAGKERKEASSAPSVVVPDPDDKEIARLVKQLGSDVFKDREAAQKRLEEIGEPALGALAKAHSPLEVRRRAEAIITAIDNKLYGKELLLIGTTAS